MAASTSYVYRSEADRTFTSPQDFYRLRDFGQKFEATVAFLRRHGRNMYRVLLLPALLCVLPMLVYSVSQIIDPPPTPTPGDWRGALAIALPRLGIVLVLAMTVYLVLYGMFYSFVKARMSNPDPAASISTGEVWAAARPYILPLIGYTFLVTVLTMLASAFLLLPGLYLIIVFQMIMPVVVFEQGGVGRTLSRCFSLISGKWWSTFGLFVIGLLAVMMCTVPLSLVSQGAMFVVMSGGGLMSKSVLALAQFAQLLVQTLLGPIFILLMLFQYFNLVERRDHVSLQWQAEQLGQTPGGPAPLSATDDTLFRPSYGDHTL